MRDDQREKRSDPSRAYRGTALTGSDPEDRRIFDEVQGLLAEDTDLDAGEVDVSVENGRVTLEGSVGGRIARERVEELTDSVKGVREIENNLRVRPVFARSFEDEPDVADAAADNNAPPQFAVSDVSGTEWGTGAASDNRPGTGLGDEPADTGAPAPGANRRR